MKWSVQNKDQVVTTLRKDLVEARKRSKVSMIESEERISDLEKQLARKTGEVQELQLKLEDAGLRFEVLKAEEMNREMLVKCWREEANHRKKELETERDELLAMLKSAKNESTSKEDHRVADITQLKNELSDLRREHTKVTESVENKVKWAEAEIEGRVAELNGELQEAQARLKEMQDASNETDSEVQELRLAKAELETHLKKSEARKGLEHQVKSLQNEVTKFHAENQNLLILLERYEIENETLKGDLNSERALFDTWRDEIEQEKHILFVRAQQAEGLVEETPRGQAHNQLVTRLEHRVFDARDELSVVRNKISRARSESENHDKNLISSESESTSSVISSNGNFQGSPAEEGLARVQDTLHTVQQMEHDTKQALERARDSNDALESELKGARQSNQQAQEEVICLKSKMSDAARDSHSLRAEVQSLKDQLQLVTNRLEQAEKAKSQLMMQRAQESLATSSIRGEDPFATISPLPQSLPNPKAGQMKDSSEADVISGHLVDFNNPVTCQSSHVGVSQAAPLPIDDLFGLNSQTDMASASAEADNLRTELDLSRVETQRAHQELQALRQSSAEMKSTIVKLEKQLELNKHSEKDLQQLREESDRNREEVKVPDAE